MTDWWAPFFARQRYEEWLREAEAARAVASVPQHDRLKLRERCGWALVRLGTALAGGKIISPANGH